MWQWKELKTEPFPITDRVTSIWEAFERISKGKQHSMCSKLKSSVTKCLGWKFWLYLKTSCHIIFKRFILESVCTSVHFLAFTYIVLHSAGFCWEVL